MKGWSHVTTDQVSPSLPSPVCRAIRTRTAAPDGHRSPASARWTSTAAATAADALVEHHKERVALGADLVPASAPDRLPEHGAVAVQDLEIAVTQGLQQPGGALTSENRNVTVSLGSAGMGPFCVGGTICGRGRLR